MAFDRSDFDPIPSSKGLANQAVYETTDNLATVGGAGYFNEIADNLRSTFEILIFASDGAVRRVGTSTSTVVTLGNTLTYA